MKCCFLGFGFLLLAGVAAAAPTRIADDGSRFVLLRGDTPFFAKGAVAPNRFELLRDCGANAVRTNAVPANLDAAHTAGLAVLANLPVRGERDGMDWDNEAMLSDLREKVLGVVRALKDHPALLVWSLGNELDYIPVNQPYNPRIWQRLNALARAVKEVDPNHPVLTVLGTSFFEQKVKELARDGTDFDLVGLNAYGDLAESAAILRAHWPKPYLVTEWGPTGHWEVAKTTWKAPLEQTSSEKAAVTADRYTHVVLADPARCLGSFVFYWSEKQETTHTWYGLFLDGLRTESIDVMEFFWRGSWPANLAPRVAALRIAGFHDAAAIVVQPGQTLQAEVTALDPDADPLTYRWDVRTEVVIPKNSYAGGGEKPGTVVPGLFRETNTARPKFRAPESRGEYRIFVAITDGQGHVAYGNVPFRVE